jgi:E3 ubiquitin-protein ligase HUWE1
LCLNEAGQTQLTKRPSIIPAIFSIFTSERHLKTLIDKENAVIIGTAVDELIRHHPALKSQVFDALKSTLSRIEDLGASYSPPADIKHWYQLVPVSTLPFDDDVTMQDDAAMESPGPIEVPQAVEDIDDDNEDDDPNPKSHDNIVVSYIDIVGRVSPQKC